MTIKTLRAEISAAHEAGNLARAEELQGQLHAINVAAADQFMKSNEGQQWINGYLMNRP